MKVLSLYLTLAMTTLDVTIASASSYGAFGNYTLGSSRVLGLGGAYTAISTDTNAFLYNPAGVVTSDADLLLDASTNRLTNSELDSDQNELQTENVTKQYDLVGAHVKLGRGSVGIGYFVPYFAELKDLWVSREHSLKIQEVGVNLSYAISKNWSLGINGKYSETMQSETLQTVSYEMASRITYWQWGVLYQKDRLAIGYSFSPELLWPKTNSLSTSFLDVKSPQKQVLGISYFVKPEKIRLCIDLVNSRKITDAIAYETNQDFYDEPISEVDFQYPKIGLEFILVKNSRTNAQFRMGYYNEPSRFRSVASRSHFTIGFEVRIGPALLQVAQDQASHFNNTAQSFSVVFDKL